MRKWLVGAVATFAAAGYAVAPLASAAPQRPAVDRSTIRTAQTPLAGAVVVGPGGAVTGYDTRVVVITQGTDLTFVNVDQLAHTVTSVARDKDGLPLFSGNALPGTTSTVAGTSKLAPGSYAFYCQYHPNMQGTLIVEALPGDSGGGTKASTPTFTQPLRVPKVLTGSHLTIPVKRADVRVMPHGPKTSMWTYAGSYPGPTIVRPVGHDTKITFVNQLPSSVGDLTVHLHGDHHSSADDGLPDSQLIKPGGRKTYDYPLTDGGRPERAAFDFYHDHRMGDTGRNVWNGLQGMFITTDRFERHLPLPKGRYELPLLVSDRSLDEVNQLQEPFPRPGDGETATSKYGGQYAAPGDATVGDRVLVNGTYAPYYSVSTHRYRLRILNGSGFQSYDFHLSTGQPFVQIGTGSGLLPKPVVRNDLLLGPAQRADVIVDFTHDFGKKVMLTSVPRTDNQPGGIGTPDVPVMQFRVAKHVRDTTRIPSTLQPPPAIKAPSVPDFVWTFGLGGDVNSGTYWTVNNHPYDPTRVDTTVEQGSTHTWLLQNLSPITHYIHLHEEQWHTISRDGRAPPAWEQGLEDTWRLDPGESVEVAGTFTDFPGVFMIHCHMLDHEDHGMMAQFAVAKPGSSSVLPAGYHYGPSTSSAIDRSGMAGMARMAMTHLGATAEVTPMWMRTAVRAGWAVAVELPLLALALLWRRRRLSPRRVVLVAALGGVAVTHATDFLCKLQDAPYLAVGFALLIAGSGVAAIAAATSRELARLQRAAAAVAALTAVGYVVSRSPLGLPQIHDHIGHWADPAGIASLVCEATLVALVVRVPRIRRSLVMSRRPFTRRRAVAAVAATLATVATAVAVPSQAATKGHVLLVCNGTASCPHVKGAHYYPSLKLAVSHATNNDWILVWPGKYSENVEVTAGRGLTSGLHIRGMNRNGVVFDGKKTGGSAVHVIGVNNTFVENMTGQNYQTGAANAFYWTGVDGYWGNYLTAYNNGDYGVYAYDSTSSGKTPSAFAHIYASWNADSGIYIGGCRDCNAVVVASKTEKNAIGYSGTNAGGELFLIDSEWDHNASGIVPNTLTSEPDPPQEGVNIIGNYVHDNNDKDIPGSGITALSPVGIGIDIAGGSNNIIRGNLIRNEKHNGVALSWLFTPATNNQVLYNTFDKVGTAGGPGDADIAYETTALQNCVLGNVDVTGGHRRPATTDPQDVANLSNCGSDNPLRQQGRGIYEPGDPAYAAVYALNALGVTEPKDYKGPGPRPDAQLTMANPCKGVPANPWCSGGKPKFKIPTHP